MQALSKHFFHRSLQQLGGKLLILTPFFKLTVTVTRSQLERKRTGLTLIYLIAKPKLLTMRLSLFYGMSRHLYFLDSTVLESSQNKVNVDVLKLILFS